MSNPLHNDSLLRFMTCGSVDDGKSTLIGRLLFDTKSILADTLTQMDRTSKKRGLETVDLSLLTDGLQAEREQGITIDVAYRYFSTGTRKYIIADAPGHEDEDPTTQSTAIAGGAVTPPTMREKSSATTATVAERMRIFTRNSPSFRAGGRGNLGTIQDVQIYPS